MTKEKQQGEDHAARWILHRPAGGALDAVASAPGSEGLPRPLLEILARRLPPGEDVSGFLDPLLANLSDPLELPDMQAAVDRLFKAVDGGEQVVLYGDYDVDGVTSVCLMREVLGAYGMGVGTLLPERKSEGYGLTEAGISRCLEQYPDTGLVVAIDCGTNSRDEVASLAARGIDTLILDHHETSDTKMAECVAVVNPKRTGKLGYLCSVGVVFKVAHAMVRARQPEGFDLRSGLDLVAMGTVADVVPLVGENRILAKRGLDRMEKTTRPGILALREVAGIRPENLRRASSIGFGLAPRINAAGRLGTAGDALELLLADDIEAARARARELDRLNVERRKVEDGILEEAQAMVAELAATGGLPKAIVLGKPGWHPGVVGIVASRLMRQYHRPALVVGFDENGVGKGSGRSISGLDLVAALDAARGHLLAGGGHAQAVGITVEEEQFGAFREAFLEAVTASLDDDLLRPRVHLDAELPLADFDYGFLDALARLEPFGNSNAEPLFLARGVVPAVEPRWLKEKHLKLALLQGDSRREAIYFNAPRDLPPPPWDVAFSPSANHFRGEVTLQMQLRAIRAAGEVEEEEET